MVLTSEEDYGSVFNQIGRFGLFKTGRVACYHGVNNQYSGFAERCCQDFRSSEVPFSSGDRFQSRYLKHFRRPENVAVNLSLLHQYSAMGKRNAQHPLADGSGRQHFAYQQSGTLHHAPCAEAGTETDSLEGEGHQFLVVAALEADSQESMFQAVTLEVISELLLHVAWQASAF